MTVPKPRSHNVPYFSRVLPKSMLQTWTGEGRVCRFRTVATRAGGFYL